MNALNLHIKSKKQDLQSALQMYVSRKPFLQVPTQQQMGSCNSVDPRWSAMVTWFKLFSHCLSILVLQHTLCHLILADLWSISKPPFWYGISLDTTISLLFVNAGGEGTALYTPILAWFPFEIGKKTRCSLQKRCWRKGKPSTFSDVLTTWLQNLSLERIVGWILR